ncbi:MAG: nuclear transport factor 2 family protein [Acidimicrobiia bacterium]
MTRDEFSRWLALYEEAWRTAGTTMLAELFAPDATYSAGPYEELHRGLDAIVELWDAEREGPDEVFTIEREVVAVEGRTGVARVHVVYGDPPGQEYRDLWIVTIDGDGRGVSFEEWPFWPPGTNGTVAGT